MAQRFPIFQHPTQADFSTTRKHGGTGLRLAICSGTPLPRRAPLPLTAAEDNLVNQGRGRGQQTGRSGPPHGVLVAWAEGLPAEAAAPLLLQFLVETNLPAVSPPRLMHPADLLAIRGSNTR
jgi:hypothetical protein